MCFRPAAVEQGPVECPGCGKKINWVAGQLPPECPFCSTSLAQFQMAAPGVSAAPGVLAPGVPAPGMPKAPAPKAPVAPKAPAAPKAPGATVSE